MTTVTRDLSDLLDQTARDVGMVAASDFEPRTQASTLRRGRQRPFADEMGILTLSDDAGVLLWGSDPVPPTLVLPGRRGMRAGPPAQGAVAKEYRFERMAANQIGSFLEGVDGKLTQSTGLRIWNRESNQLVPASSVPKLSASDRVVLFVHGTFSSCDHMFAEEFLPLGSAWLAGAGYKHVMTFDHPTLSRSPILNACELSRLFQGVEAQVDVIAHSRGGVVTRWWLETLGGAAFGKRRVILVGCPIAGTSLAAPARLKSAMSLLTNVGNALRGAGALASAWSPLLSVPMAVLKVITSVTGSLARTPLLDAAVALIPGLSGQSAVQNNFEIRLLRGAACQRMPDYFAITSNFEPTDPGWKFWQYFRKDRLLDRAADYVFDGENDLVVDTGSMTSLFDDPAGLKPRCILDYQKSPLVHHANYFRQPQTIAAIAEAFQA
jgi:pimeloyl-ACP methyl ester carboxylesterase